MEKNSPTAIRIAKMNRLVKLTTKVGVNKLIIYATKAP